MRVSWGSALFSLASASPGRERQRGQREEDGADGKIRPLYPTSPAPSHPPRRWRLEEGWGRGRRQRPGHSFSLSASCELCKGAGVTGENVGCGEKRKRARGGRTEHNSVEGMRLAQKQNPTTLGGATLSLALVSKPPQKALTSYTALFSKQVEVILGAAPGLGRPGTPSGSWSCRALVSLKLMLGCS